MFSGKYILLRSIEESDIIKVSQWNFDIEIAKHFESRFPNNVLEQKKWFDAQINQIKKS